MNYCVRETKTHRWFELGFLAIDEIMNFMVELDHVRHAVNILGKDSHAVKENIQFSSLLRWTHFVNSKMSVLRSARTYVVNKEIKP